jgi:hypothetical protein
MTAADKALAALLDAVDRPKLDRALAAIIESTGGTAVLPPSPLSKTPSPGEPSSAQRNGVFAKLVLEDLLGDEILGARPADSYFPLRLFLGNLSSQIAAGSLAALSFAAGLNFYFRQTMDEESRASLGFSISEAFYGLLDAPKGAPEAAFSDDRATEGLLAALLSTELSALVFESASSARTFSSAEHERHLASDPTASTIVSVKSFCCKVRGNGLIKRKARVLT